MDPTDKENLKNKKTNSTNNITLILIAFASYPNQLNLHLIYLSLVLLLICFPQLLILSFFWGGRDGVRGMLNTSLTNIVSKPRS